MDLLLFYYTVFNLFTSVAKYGYSLLIPKLIINNDAKTPNLPEEQFLPTPSCHSPLELAKYRLVHHGLLARQTALLAPNQVPVAPRIATRIFAIVRGRSHTSLRVRDAATHAHPLYWQRTWISNFIQPLVTLLRPKYFSNKSAGQTYCNKYRS